MYCKYHGKRHHFLFRSRMFGLMVGLEGRLSYCSDPKHQDSASGKHEYPQQHWWKSGCYCLTSPPSVFVSNGAEIQPIYPLNGTCYGFSWSPCSTNIHICFHQCAYSCISLPACIYVYFMSVQCMQLFELTRCASVFRYLKTFCSCLIVSTSDTEKHQQCIPWFV